MHLKRKYEAAQQSIQELEGLVDELRATAAGQLDTLTDVENELREKDEMLQYVESEVAELKEKFRCVCMYVCVCVCVRAFSSSEVLKYVESEVAELKEKFRCVCMCMFVCVCVFVRVRAFSSSVEVC